MDWDFTRIEVRKGQVYYVPAESAAVRGLVFLRNGLYLGEIRKDRFEPSQALAVSLKKRSTGMRSIFPPTMSESFII
ncbi:MAG: RsmF rRNA methyltransferase first C-terminal domain-containing protein [Lachnospiraceae bacterium]